MKFSMHVICCCGSIVSDGNAIRYVLPVLWMTSCFHSGANGTMKDDVLRPVCQVAAPVAKSALLGRAK